MRAVVYRGPRHVELVARAAPRLQGPRDALVRVTRSAICGTDLHPYRGELAGFRPDTVLGHEFVGVVAETGSEVDLPLGTRVVASDVVACGRCASCARGWHYQCDQVGLFGYSDVVGRPLDGGQAELVRVPFADTVLSVCPDELSDEQMLFVGDVLSTGYAAAAATRITPGDVVGVVGAGPVGLLSALCLRLCGAALVVLADPEARRRTAARSLGLEATTPTELPAVLQAAAGGSGARAVVEAVGSAAALDCAIDAAGQHATVVVVGAPSTEPPPLAVQRAFANELTLRFVVGDPIRDGERVTALVRAGLLDPTVVVSHRLPLTDAVEAYQLFDRREAVKVIMVHED
ncbi:alcohol dehydrogenase catalytic domain-containing protein [Streptomyces sp. NPDC020731]|uniref:alcohol dehydrogenase catalytic domain-containing protein n=1 Tax=Streptomyces sp. NPDC020731 TaxID=3365085 RepID=UPI003799A834